MSLSTIWFSISIFILSSCVTIAQTEKMPTSQRYINCIDSETSKGVKIAKFSAEEIATASLGFCESILIEISPISIAKAYEDIPWRFRTEMRQMARQRAFADVIKVRASE
jgi:hypothetical protein